MMVTKVNGLGLCGLCNSAMNTLKEEAGDLVAVGEKIGIDVLDWPNRCFEVACAFIKHRIIIGKPCYGMYCGPISDKSVFAGRRFARHGWIFTPHGFIVDPTRWVFEAIDPYLFITRSQAEYDLGSMRMRHLGRSSFPADDLSEKCISLDVSNEILEQYAGPGDWSKLTKPQVHWLATVMPDTSDDYIKMLNAICKAGQQMFIPVDIRTFYLDEPIAMMERV